MHFLGIFSATLCDLCGSAVELVFFDALALMEEPCTGGCVALSSPCNRNAPDSRETQPRKNGTARSGVGAAFMRIRLPDMLGMPGEGEFRSNRPATGGASGSGAVIARPPAKSER